MGWSFILIPLLLAASPAPAQAPARPAPPSADSLAAPCRPGWVVDGRNGCWVWAQSTPSGLTVTWSGACPRGPAQGQGQGEWRYTEGGQTQVVRFSGTRSEGRMEGRGTYTWADGGRYEGEWRDDRADGYGEYYVAARQFWVRGQWAGGGYRGAEGRAAINRPLSECP